MKTDARVFVQLKTPEKGVASDTFGYWGVVDQRAATICGRSFMRVVHDNGAETYIELDNVASIQTQR